MNDQGLRRMRGWATVLLVLLVTACAGTAFAEDAGSNLEVMTDLTRDVAADVITALDGARAGRPLRLVMAAATEEYRFIEQVFTTVLNERGVQVYLPAATPGAKEAQGKVLDLKLQANEFGVTYPQVFRSYLVGGKKVRRTARVAISATLVDPDNEAVLDVAAAERSGADQFKYGHIDNVEQGTFAFVRPEVPSSGWTRVVEPVLVTGIVVGLIYLFFSNQSDN